jgi:hypothetical protein
MNVATDEVGSMGCVARGPLAHSDTFDILSSPSRSPPSAVRLLSERRATKFCVWRHVLTMYMAVLAALDFVIRRGVPVLLRPSMLGYDAVATVDSQ